MTRGAQGGVGCHGRDSAQDNYAVPGKISLPDESFSLQEQCCGLRMIIVHNYQVIVFNSSICGSEAYVSRNCWFIVSHES